jgi:hypothetical protein
MPTGTTMIMVVRHAEKPDPYNGVAYAGVDPTGQTCGSAGIESLVTLGWERAGGLVTLFAPPWGPKAPLLQPAHIYASDPSTDDKGKVPSQRPFETVTPLAAMLGLTIKAGHKKKDYGTVVTDALAKSGPVLICWQHEDILPIGQSILSQTGTTGIALPPGWPVDKNNIARYDLVWVFSRPTGTGQITGFTQFAQMLLPGDGPAPE